MPNFEDQPHLEPSDVKLELEEKLNYFKNFREKIMHDSQSLNNLTEQYKKEFLDYFGIRADGPNVELHDIVEAVIKKIQ